MNKPYKSDKEVKKCESYVDHEVQWAGDGYYCSRCMIPFAPRHSDRECYKQEIVERVREEVTKYVQEAIKDPKSENYIYADMIPLTRLDKILSLLNEEVTK